MAIILRWFFFLSGEGTQPISYIVMCKYAAEKLHLKVPESLSF